MPNRFPDFGKELQRPFEVHEACYACVEFYGPGRGVVGCNAWLASKAFNCADFLRLPDVMPGTSGQVFPASRMGGRKEPRIRSVAGTVVRAPVQPENPPADLRARAEPEPEPIEQDPPKTDRLPKQPRRQSPAATPGPDGERLCGCGALLRKRQRCCGDCRLKRREETMNRRRHQNRPVVEVETVSGVPFFAPGTLSTQRRSGAHN